MQLQNAPFHLGQGSAWLNKVLFDICPIENIDELSSWYYTKERGITHFRIGNVENVSFPFDPPLVKVALGIPIVHTPVIMGRSDPGPRSAIPVKVDKVVPPVNTAFTPNQPDPLFWCIFVFQYGMCEYTQIQKYANRRLEENKKMGDSIRKNPKILKTGNHAITNGLIQEIISECFITKDTTSHIQLIAMSIYYNIRIILMKADGQSYITFQPQNFQESGDDVLQKDCVIYEYIKPNKRLSYRMNMGDATDKDDRSGLYQWNTWYQPLRGQGAYKLPDLVNIASRLKIDPIGLKKGELYAKIEGFFQEKN